MHSLTYIFWGGFTLCGFVTAVRVNERGAGRAGEHRHKLSDHLSAVLYS